MKGHLDSRCLGVGGKLFGHKFKINLGDYAYSEDYCSRCGMPKGGWSTSQVSYIEGHYLELREAAAEFREAYLEAYGGKLNEDFEPVDGFARLDAAANELDKLLPPFNQASDG